MRKDTKESKKNELINQSEQKSTDTSKYKEEDYMALGMSMGMCLGMTIGQLIFDNMIMGMSVGMCLGLAVGTSIKKKEK